MNQKNIEALEKIISKDHANIAEIIVQRNATKIYENYFNGYDANSASMCFR